MGAEPGRRFLKQPAEKLKAVFVAQETSRARISASNNAQFMWHVTANRFPTLALHIK